MEAEGILCENRVKKHVLVGVLKTLFHIVATAHHWFVQMYGGLNIILISNIHNPIEDLRFLAQYTLAYGTNWNFVSIFHYLLNIYFL